MDARVGLLAAIPELGDGLTDAERRFAAGITCPRRSVAAGTQLPASDAAGGTAVVAVVVSGFMLRRVQLAEGHSSEVLGPGDVIVPSAGADLYTLVEYDFGFRALTHATLAVVTPACAAATARVPKLLHALFERVARRGHCLAALNAVSHMRRIDDRLLALFAHLAEMYGRVTPEGIVVPVPLTHSQIGRIIGAERPSVTTSLMRLRRRGVVWREPGGAWLCRGLAADLPVGARSDAE